MNAKRIPTEVFPVGEFVQDELDERNWSHGDLAERTGLSCREISDIICDRRTMLAKDAVAIGRAFDCGGEILLRLQRADKRARKQ